MRRSFASLVLIFCLALPLRGSVGPGPRPTAAPQASFAQPGISPDGAEIAFVSAGDIWVVPANGGEARLLVAHAGSDERPLYSPDGSRLAFMSDRSGSMDIWTLTFATGLLTRLTLEDSNELLDAWSRDGEWIYFSSQVPAGMNVFRVRAAGGTPMLVAADEDVNESMAAPAPDGRSIAIVAHGNPQQWWRKGRSHQDESELWTVRIDTAGPPRYDPITPRGAKQQWPMYADNGALYFVSDRTGGQNLWVKPPGDEARRLTSFTEGRVAWPSMSRAGAIAFERDFGIWVYDPGRRTSERVQISLRGAAVIDRVEHLSLTSGFSSLAVSPDGKKVAFVGRGEVFAASAADGGDAARVSRSTAAEDQVTWSPDSRKVAYSANRVGAWQLYTHDFSSGSEIALTGSESNANLPRFAPDGKSIAFIRNATDVCVVSLDTRAVRVVARGFFGRPPSMAQRPLAWSPDSRWIAYLSAGPKLFQNAWIVPIDGGGARQVTWLADAFAWPYSSAISWSADGTFLTFNTGARTEAGQLVRVDLLPRTPRFREDQFSSLFADQRPPATPGAGNAAPPSDVRVDLEGVRQRLRVLPIGLDVTSQVLSPDGKSVIITAAVAGQQHLFLYSLDELSTDPAVARQITTTAAAKTSVQFTADGKSVWYLEGGRPTTTVLEPRSTRSLAVRAELDVKFVEEKWEVFHQAWEYLNENFYDETFHGVDWNGVRAAYAPRLAGARLPSEMRRILNLMVGELDASHMGVNAPPPGLAPTVGRLGLDFDREAYETRGAFVIASVVPSGPAAVTGAIRPGDIVLAVDGTALDRTTNLSGLLAYKPARKVSLTVVSNAAGGNRRDVAVRPVVWFDESTLRYRARVERRREMVARLSGGRLGYVHIPDMGTNAPADLALALDAEIQAKEGVILDVRNNGGGFTNGHVLDVLLRKPYIDMAQRGVPAVSGRHLLGQRALQAPTILITNQYSGSDAENFTEGYRVLGLGKVVGEPTAGADVFTTSGPLVDGSTVRLPYMRNAQLDQTALERAPRKVDVPVTRVMGESYAGRDAQLEAAVKELLARIGDKRGGQAPH